MKKQYDVFSIHLANYLTYKRAAGYKYEKEERVLRRFLKNCEPFFDDDNLEIPKTAVIAWNERGINETSVNQNSRIGIVRRFCLYLTKKNIPAYVSHIKHFDRSNFEPYIFTNNELHRFFEQTDKVISKVRNSSRHLIMPIIFRLYYSSGLRESEALNLTVGDVDLKNGILTIRNTKFEKDRLVPIHESVLQRMCNYSETVHRTSEPHTPFFPASHGGFYGRTAIYNTYRKLLLQAKIPHRGKGTGPRVHDFRHTFAVHCLRKWSIECADLSVALPYLSSYMGHNGLAYTQLYLRLTSDLYPDVVKKMESKFDVIPKWEVVNETY
jgi:integrase